MTRSVTTGPGDWSEKSTSSSHQDAETGDSGLQLDAVDFQRIMQERLPFAELMGIKVDYFEADHVRLRAAYDANFLRPGGSIAGPIMMGLADVAVYALVLSRIGPVELALTTHLSINFLKKPAPGDVLADARLLKLGKRLAVGEVCLFSESGHADKPIAHATATYSIPPPEHRQS